MELPGIGKQCEEPTCQRLDFLPYTCKCKKTFCADHYIIHAKSCPTITEHYKQANLEKEPSNLWSCAHPDCKKTSLLPLMFCNKCNQHFCIAHRHITECFKEDPALRQAAIAKLRAPIEKFNAAKAKIDKQLDEKIEAALNKTAKTQKKNEMAIKLQLMRIKNKATGLKSILHTDRVYFNVTKPEKYGSEAQAVFVSKTWSVGRTIDAIAEECKVVNRNNVDAAEKLRLFKNEDQLMDLSRIINDLLLENVLIDGQNLTLEYVSE